MISCCRQCCFTVHWGYLVALNVGMFVAVTEMYFWGVIIDCFEWAEKITLKILSLSSKGFLSVFFYGAKNNNKDEAIIQTFTI